MTTNDPSGNTVFLTYAAEVTGTGDEGDIFFTKSTNGGLNWTTPIRVNNDATTNDQIHPEIAQKPNGDIDLSKVVLCGDACEAVESDPNARVEILIGCRSIVVV